MPTKLWAVFFWIVLGRPLRIFGRYQLSIERSYESRRGVTSPDDFQQTFAHIAVLSLWTADCYIPRSRIYIGLHSWEASSANIVAYPPLSDTEWWLDGIVNQGCVGPWVCPPEEQGKSSCISGNFPKNCSPTVQLFESDAYFSNRGDILHVLLGES